MIRSNAASCSTACRIRGPWHRLLAWAAVVAAGLGASGRACAAEPADSLALRVREYLEAPPDTESPIPNLAITKETYRKWLRFSGHLNYARQDNDHGQFGPRHFMPVLAEFVHTRDPAYARACVRMLYDFDRWIREEVRKVGWHVAFCQEPGYIGIYQTTLSRAGQLSAADKAMLQELLVFMARHIHAWATPETFWRGPMHRAQGEGFLKGLAAAWYPDTPEAAEWKAYAANVYDDWWRFRDLAPNDVNYLFATIQPLMLRANLIGDDDFYTDPTMRRMWERLMYEVSPDGSIPPYGAHWGWNQSVGNRIAVLEMLSAKTRDGRFRFVAHRLMNYLLYQRLRYYQHHMLIGPDTTEAIALAYLYADDTVKPVEPDPRSRVLERQETVRLPSPTQKEAARALLGENVGIDPRPDHSMIDCCMLVTDQVKPSKFALRSGWQRGDFFVLVDLFPRHDPLNPLGILGITRWGAGLACTTSAKGRSRENRVVLERIGDQPPPEPPTPETSVNAFVDAPLATYAAARVTNYDETTAEATRHFLFVKNRFLLVRDEVRLPPHGQYKVTSVFNTQRAVRVPDFTAAITWFDDLQCLGNPLLNPPVNLLVWFLPTQGFALDVADRSLEDESTTSVPLQLRYSGTFADHDDRSTIRLGLLLRPQTPVDSFPHPPAGAAFPDEAARMVVLHDDADALAVRLGTDAGDEIAVINPAGKQLTLPGVTTRAAAAYFRLLDGAVEQEWQSPDPVPRKTTEP